MNRTDRLYALVEELRRAGRRTSAALAATFEVSQRTIKRDILALQESGVPVWAEPGPGGGYVLDSDASLPPVNFTARQAIAVAVALAAVKRAPFAADGAAALAKVVDVLSSPARERAKALASRVWVNDDRPFPSPSSPAAASAIEEALTRHVVVALDYVSASGEKTRRRVEPMIMALTYGHWYLIAWCQERAGVRWFRWDRVADARLTTEPAPERELSLIGEFPPTAHSVLD